MDTNLNDQKERISQLGGGMLELVNIRQVFKFLQAKNVMSGYRFIFLHHNTVETDVVT